MNEALENAWKEFERTGEIANSADELLGYATRLTEENAKLRGALTNLAGRGERFINLDEIRFDLDSDDIASIESNFNESLIDAEKPLNQLKDKTNDK